MIEDTERMTIGTGIEAIIQYEMNFQWPVTHLISPATHLFSPATHLFSPATHLIGPDTHLFGLATHLNVPLLTWAR